VRCPDDLTPLVSTFERPGCEWHCLYCGQWFALFHVISGDMADDDVRQHQQLVELFATGARGPMDLPPIPPPAEPSPDNITCDGCGRDSGRTVAEGKPSAWYERSDADGTQRACSRACITTIAERTGKTRVVLPW